MMKSWLPSTKLVVTLFLPYIAPAGAEFARY